jgi:NAD(P)-dependent dehydrogenase (short-subunit alcohol dehydrogenase family)
MSGWHLDDMPDQAGRTAVITGANSGIGFEIAKALAAHGCSVVLAVRNLNKGNDACQRIPAEHPTADLSMQQVDLASLSSIRSAAEKLRSSYPRIGCLGQQRRGAVDTQVFDS